MFKRLGKIYVDDSGVRYKAVEDIPLAELFKTILNAKKWTLSALQKETGIDKAQISRIINGKRKSVIGANYMRVVKLFCEVVK